jgi:hypothetical protein
MNSFVDVIAHHYSRENNNFIRSIFFSLTPLEAKNVGEVMKMKDREKMYYRLLDQLSSSTRIISFLNNDFSLITNYDDNIKRTITNSCGSVLIVFLRHLQVLNVRLTNNKLEKYQNTLFTPSVKFLDEYFMANKCLQNDILITELLDFLVTTSNRTIIIPILINANCPQVCLRWLSLSYLNSYQYTCILTILCNIARHNEGAIILNTDQCYKILCQFEDNMLHVKIDFTIDMDVFFVVVLSIRIIVILSMDLDKLPNDNLYAGIYHLLLSGILVAFESRQFTYRGFDISELLIVLMKICIYDNILDRLLQKHYDRFLLILENFFDYIENTRQTVVYLDSDVLSVMALSNIIWSISFHDQYRNDLIKHIELIKKFNNYLTKDEIDEIIVNIHIPSYMCSLKRTIDGIWYNLYPSLPSTPVKSNLSLMISYSHVNLNFCRQLYDLLSQVSELTISVDINNCKYLWKDIAESIEQSDLVLFLISKDFFMSKSCRQEFIHVTDRLKKWFIPVFIDPNYKAIDWLDKRIAESKCIRFGEKDFMNTYDELLTIIQQVLCINISSDKRTLDITKWNDKEVKQWFINNKILSELYDFYQFQNGNELLLYAQAVSVFSWTKEYERIRPRFEKKFEEQEQNLSSHKFLAFINALECLKNKAVLSN